MDIHEFFVLFLQLLKSLKLFLNKNFNSKRQVVQDGGKEMSGKVN